MIRRFCDQCEKEITKQNRVVMEGEATTRMTATIKSLKVQVMIYQDGCSNAGDYCKYCILDVLYRLDDRPKPV